MIFSLDCYFSFLILQNNILKVPPQQYSIMVLVGLDSSDKFSEMWDGAFFLSCFREGGKWESGHRRCHKEEGLRPSTSYKTFLAMSSCCCTSFISDIQNGRPINVTANLFENLKWFLLCLQLINLLTYYGWSKEQSLHQSASAPLQSFFPHPQTISHVKKLFFNPFRPRDIGLACVLLPRITPCGGGEVW